MENIDNSIKKNRKKSILLIIFILVLIVSVMGGTYAYLAFSASNNTVVVGEIGVADLDLRVTKVTTNNGELVPQLEKALGTAVSSTHNCVDGNGNTVCQVYKIEIENTGTAKVVVDGTIDFTNTTLPNLKYKLMTNSTTLDTTFNSRYGYGDMPDRPMVRGVSLEPEQVEDYYIVFWINDTENEQPDTGTYRASINFNSSYLEGLTSTYVNYLESFSSAADSSYFRSYQDEIKSVSFVNYIDTSNAVTSWDMGTLQNGGIMAWLENNTTSGYYDLYIGSTEIIRGLDMSYYFYGMEQIDSISFDNLDTSMVTKMVGMFSRVGSNSTVFTLDLGDNFDTSNVIDMSEMFLSTASYCSVFTLDLGDNFDTSNVTDMSDMFGSIGFSSTVFTLDLGNKFDTSNVMDMSSMFGSFEFPLNLGNKFDTSNVTDMSCMFYYSWGNDSNFELDLTKFTFDKVTSYTNMFYNFKSTQKIYVKNESDKAWLVGKGFTNVTNDNVIVRS